MKLSTVKFFNELSLKNKIFVSCLGFTLIVSFLIALFTRGLLIAGLTGELQKRGIGIAQSAADNARSFILTGNRAELTSLAYDVKTGNRKNIILYVVIADQSGKILAHTFTTGMTADIRRVVKKTPPGGQAVRELTVMNQSVFHVCVPVKEGIYTIGSVHAGLAKEHIETLIARLRLIFLSFLSVVTLIFFFLSHRLALHITRPVSALIRYTERMGRGESIPREDLEQISLEIQAREDEIAALTNSFIQMTSELKISTDRLKESQEKYKSMFRSGPNPIFVVHRDSLEILDANPKATELFGYEPDELIGTSLTDLGTLEKATFDLEFPEGHSLLISSKVQFFKKNKEVIYVNIHAGTAEFGNREVIIVAATDISELIEKDSALIQASKMTNLEKMSAGIAHEINQPLNAIKMGSEYLCMMLEKEQDIPVNDLGTVAGEISAQVSRASEIVDRLKTFSRKADFTREEINLNQCIKNVHKIIGRQITLQGIEFTLCLDDAIPRILAHNNRMEQVIFNLVTNARDAINERIESLDDPMPGKIKITSFAGTDLTGFEVKDNGMGIKQDQLDNIFESFYTTKEMGEGLGLGLPILKGIIQDYNGTISVVSTPKTGACFRVVFPARTKGLKQNPQT